MIFSDLKKSEMSSSKDLLRNDDPKSQLSVYCQKNRLEFPTYEIVGYGKDHERYFICNILHQNEYTIGSPQRTKKEAEQFTAARLLEKYLISSSVGNSEEKILIIDSDDLFEIEFLLSRRNLLKKYQIIYIYTEHIDNWTRTNFDILIEIVDKNKFKTYESFLTSADLKNKKIDFMSSEKLNLSILQAIEKKW